VRGYYEFYTDLLMRLHTREPSAGHNAAAIQSSERARARSLLDTLTEARRDIHQGADPQLLERARRMQQQLNAKSERLTRLLGGKHSDEEAATAEKDVRALLTEYEQVQTQIRLSSPRYAALTQPAPLSLREIQEQVLDDDTLLLEYALGDERSYLWAVTRDSITSFELLARRQIETAAQQFYRLIRASHRTGAKAQTDIAALGLSKMLLGPVAGQLRKNRLVIVADGALQYVPFGVLPVVRPPSSVVRRKATDYGQRTTDHQQPLIAEHEIINLPSASVMAVLRRELVERRPASKTVAVVADPVFAANDERVKIGTRGSGLGDREKTSTRTSASRTPSLQPRIPNPEPRTSDIERSAKESGVMSFDRLRFSRREAEAITSLVPEQERLKALDFSANRATAMSSELGQYRILHFATHGLLNSLHPALSGLVLSLVDEKGQPQDGFLRLHEIYNLKLGADLVVLSACRTALGKDVRGEGLIGLTRGFMYAGAPRVVVSLWNVSDEATAQLMKRFYHGTLVEGLSPAAALRAAQVSMWKQKRWEAPYYWAAFMLQGEWR
jgi:CHAT domain-containing protein